MRALVAVVALSLAMVPGILPAQPPAGQASAPTQLPSLAPMLENVLPAVVSISVKGTLAGEENPLLQDPFFRRFFGDQMPQERPFEAIGSGVIVDARQGIIVTNAHIVERADELSVTLSSGQQLEAKKVGIDPETDIAVLRVEQPQAAKLTALPWGDTSTLRVGDYVVAVGNPFGLEQTVTSGIVSALGRTGLGIEGYEDFIQTDASINPGNSGGALVNLRGELVGINTAILAPTGGNIGIGFAIPASMARGVVQQLIEHGEVRRGQLGVVVQDLTPALAEALGTEARQGAVVTEVVPNSAAAKAGLQVGDVVVSVNGQAVTSSGELRNRVGLMAIGERPKLTVRRGNQTVTVQPTIAEAEDQAVEGGRLDPRLEGAVFEAVGGRPAEGVVVASKVAPGSPAFRAGLRSGDRIASVNRRQIETIQAFRQAVQQASGPILFGVNRRGTSLLIAVQ